MATADLTDFHSHMAQDLVQPVATYEADHLEVNQQATVNALRAITHGLLAMRNQLSELVAAGSAVRS